MDQKTIDNPEFQGTKMVYSLRSRSKSPLSSRPSSNLVFFNKNEEDTTATTDWFDDNNNYRSESPTYENGYMFRKRSVTGSNNISLTIGGGINGKIPNGVIKPIPRKPDNTSNEEVTKLNTVGSPKHPRHQLLIKPAKRGRHRIHSVDDILDNSPKKRKTDDTLKNNNKENNFNHNTLQDNNNNKLTNNKNDCTDKNKFLRYSRTNTSQKKFQNHKDGDGKVQNFKILI